MKPPQISPVDIDWDSARAELTKIAALQATAASDATLARLNAAADHLFAGIADSAVPVLLPFDPDATSDSGNISAQTAGFRPVFFVAGPTGYDAAFAIPSDLASKLSGRRKKKVDVTVHISGFSLLYNLERSIEGKPVKDLDADFPGIRRAWHESNVRYSFRRFGVPYTVSMLCVEGPPRGRWIACRDADRIILRLLGALRLAGGTPQPAVTTKVETIARPDGISPDFTYAPSGGILPRTGFRRGSGRADDTVYAKIKFPIANAPAYANSQSFMNWGNCDFTGRTSRSSRKGAVYRCKVNDKPLVFDESAPENRAYPWRDNFCEHRHFFVGECPGGKGHQGQDIRPATCKLRNDGADRCLPYQDDVVAARDGIIMRAPGRELMYLVVNVPGERVRFRYLHMNPKKLDADGMSYGRKVREGEIIGKVGNYDKKENGTTYHLHFDMQVPTEAGWVLVNPYMTLVAGYERLIGGRGREVSDDVMIAAPEKSSDQTESIAIGTSTAPPAPAPHAITAPVAR